MRTEPLLPHPSASARHAIRRSMLLALPTVERFVMGTLIYVLSQMWYDLLSTYILQLHPVPYCDNAATRPCSPEAPPSSQTLFALCLLLALGLLDRAAALLHHCSPRLHAALRLRVYTPLAGMCVGWAFGAAAVQASHALTASRPLKLALSAVGTLLSSLLLLLLRSAFDTLLLSLAVAVAALHSSAAPCVHAARLLRQLELLLSTLLRLLSTALTTMVMILWNDALSKAVVADLTPAEQHKLGTRLWFLWSLSLTFGLSGVSVCLARLRASLAAAAPRAAPPHAAAGGAACGVLCAAVRRQCAQTSWRAEVAAVCSVLEATFGWVTGCAWTNFVGAVWASLDDYPTAAVFFYDLLASLSVSLVAVVWLVASNGARADGAAEGAARLREREHVELYFITTSACFFVGWCYITCLRDLTTVVAALGPGSATNFVGEAVLLALLASALTWALVRLFTLSLRTYSAAAAADAPPPAAAEEAEFGPVLGAGRAHAAEGASLVAGGGAPLEPLHVRPDAADDGAAGGEQLGHGV
ncbi:hypothetical protein AB1Y20_012562 [Prymnesium parvum]|uniref:Protein RFT1 homolog n=1 Tax=Prymnesium parvum TaxID=97485 RepID=A0AB34II79_PRYPA